MKKAIFYSLLIVIIVLKALFPSDIIRIEEGPLYIQNSIGKGGVKRYLPNIIIKFRYRDTKGEDFTEIHKTNEKGNIIDAELPVSEGAKIYGIIKGYYTLVDYTKSVYNDKGDILVTTSIKIEAPFLEKTPQGFIEINEELIYNSNTDKWIFPPISITPMQSHLPASFNDKYFAMHAYYLGTQIERIVGSSPSTIVINNNATASSYKSDIITIASLTCTSKYDSLYKHELGHFYTDINNLNFETEGYDWRRFENNELKTAYSEGFSDFVASQPPCIDDVNDFSEYLQCDENLKECSGSNLSCLLDFYKKNIRKIDNFFDCSPETIPGAITASLMKSGFDYNLLLTYFKNRDWRMKELIDAVNKSKSEFMEYLESIGIIYLRAVFSNPLEDLGSEKSDYNIPLVKKEKVGMNVRSAVNSDLKGLKEYCYGSDPIPDKHIEPQGISIEVIPISDDHIKKIFNKDGTFKDNAVELFYKNYWNKKWERFPADKTSNGSSAKIEVKFKTSGFYALRAKAVLNDRIEDKLGPIGADLKDLQGWFSNIASGDMSKSLLFVNILMPPKMTIKKMQIGPLHYETFEYESFYSYGNRHLDKSTSSYIRLNPKILNAWGDEISSPYQRDLKDRCINDIPARYPDCRKDYMTLYLGGYKPTYFLNRDLSLKAKFYAELESDISLKEFTPEGIREFIRLELKTRNPHKPGAVHEELDITSYCNIEIDNENSKIVKLTIKPINIIKSINGYQSLLLETTNGKQGDEKQVYSGKSLFYFKDTSGPIVTGTEQDPISGRIHYLLTDFDSGWTSNHLQTIVTVGDFENYYDVAMNNGTVPNESEFVFDKEPPLGEPAKLGAVKDIELVKDESAINGISLNGSWCSVPADYIWKDHSYGIILLWNFSPLNTWSINPFSTDHILFDNIRLWLLSDIENWEDIKIHEVDLTEDKIHNNINERGIKISYARDIIEYIEPKYIKILVTNEFKWSDTFIKKINFNVEKPIVDNIKKDDNYVYFDIKDFGTPISKLDFKLNSQSYQFDLVNNISSHVIVPKPDDERQLYLLRVRMKDLANNVTDQLLFKDEIPPIASLNFDPDKNFLSSSFEDNQSGVDFTRLTLSIDGMPVKLDAKKNDNYSGSFNYPCLGKLSEGDHIAKLDAFDYNGNSTSIKTEVFTITYGPEIKVFNSTSVSPIPSFYALIYDKSNDVDPNSFEISIDGSIQVDGEFVFDKSTGILNWYGKESILVGKHTATLTVKDEKGLTDKKSIEFNLIELTQLSIFSTSYRDIEGNGDGVINESERAYLDINIKNTGHATADAVRAELINRSRYIKGVPESKAGYGQIPFNSSVGNNKPYEFVVEDNIFKQVDIERVDAEFILRVFYTVKYGDKTIEKTVEFPLTVPIEKLDPSLSAFRIWVNSSIKETLDPNYTLKGGWYAEGTFLKEIKAEISSGALLIPVDIVRDDVSKTFTGNAILSTGENRFVVTAVADNGAVRTAEVSIRLDSRVGVKLDPIADTREANVTVTGNAWTENSKLDRIEIYLNGGLAGNAALNADLFSLPVVLNGGENIIRAVARDDQGKSAYDEIKVNMHGPLTLRWQRPHWRTAETPVTACGRYEVEGGDIASIVTYVNDAPNTYEVVIDRNLKTFCTKADLRPGSNLLHATGTTTGGITTNAYSRIDYGGLSIALNTLPEATTIALQTISGRYTLLSDDPFTIEVIVQQTTGGWGWASYTPIINPVDKTFSVDVTLYDRFGWCSDLLQDCGCASENQIIATIRQGTDVASDEWYITVGWPVINYGVTYYDPNLCYPTYSPVGWIEGRFQIADPTVHISSIVIRAGGSSGDKYYNVTNWNESSGSWRFDFTDYEGWGTWHILITATDGNVYGCIGEQCPGAAPPYSIDHTRKRESNKQGIIKGKKQREKVKERL